ncbi:MAG: UDP-N-acetylmuramoyl-L-alanyl-D-glutamate--2,6-diaminopimelate ligase [Coriobacteriia bacterium]|nr:UDP-N-acetylmuramoyl-L-alanyl-D-glutamate--2,6-diaminopimelate ligase [Coriobacteriia bacterium]
MDSHTLADLLETVSSSGADGLSTAISGVAYRSDRVRAGDAFFCIRGKERDGHDFAMDAVLRGAAVLVVERALPGAGVPQVLVHDGRIALASASARLFGEPTKRLEVVGVTGTNGKTTTCYLIDSIARASGRRTGLIGTVETRIGQRCEPAGRTTPESRDLQELFARMVADGVDTVAMEVSSHAIDLHRVHGVCFAVAAFTNLSQDHLDYHGTMEEYFAVKSRLFSELGARSRVVCVDDEAGSRLAAMTGAEITVGRGVHAAVRAVDEVAGPTGSTFTLVTPSGEVAVRIPHTGAFNVSNALVAAGCGLSLGIPLETIASGLAHAPQVPGRLERVDEGQGFAVLVDYAHTPDGLAKAIGAVRAVTPGRVITVFGCGGDRDTAKRPLMGETAGSLSDIVVVTSDNPRGEDPDSIVEQVLGGLHGASSEVLVEVDRRTAIGSAISMASDGDAVLIAGKGHEDYQIFASGTIRFDDREVARAALRTRAGEPC